MDLLGAVNPCVILQDTLARHTRRRVVTAWHDVYIHNVMKRFQMARAQGLYREHVEQHVLSLWQGYVKAQLHKIAMMSTADAFCRCFITHNFPMHMVCHVCTP